MKPRSSESAHKQSDSQNRAGQGEPMGTLGTNGKPMLPVSRGDELPSKRQMLIRSDFYPLFIAVMSIIMNWESMGIAHEAPIHDMAPETTDGQPATIGKCSS